MSRQQPLRSQSFKHRSPRPCEPRRGTVTAEDGGERRRSTPNVTRRASLQRTRDQRSNCWPEAKQPSEIEERFLRLPDSESFTRVRQFKIDSKGVVVSRGDSFRRKKHDTSVGKMEQEATSGENTQSRSSSICSNVSEKLVNAVDQKPTPPPPSYNQLLHPHYKIAVLGQAATGKSALISQFITSEYRNPFALDSENVENTVSINIGGQESDLVFYETDSQDESAWLYFKADLFLLVYSIDSRSSFRHVIAILDTLRQNPQTRNTPVVLAANKVDLERKRAVSSEGKDETEDEQSETDATSAAMTFAVAHFEISVALNHDVDELLVGIVAEMKGGPTAPVPCSQVERVIGGDSDFRAAIRRFSQRKKKQMGAGRGIENETPRGGCNPFTPQGIIDSFRRWRRNSKCLE